MIEPESAASRGGFFAVDEEAWRGALRLGLNPACAFLVMAAGTGRGQRKTAWSVNAIENYARIGRLRAAQAIATLEAGGLVRIEKNGTRPIYDIGLPAIESTDARQMIWMPASFVRGTDPAVGDSPLARIRQSRNIDVLKLAVELYACHDLPGEGGINRRHLCKKFTGSRLYERGRYAIWSFEPEGIFASAADRPGCAFTGGVNHEANGWAFWGALRVLKDQGVIEWVPHLCEAGHDGEVSFSLSPSSHIQAERDVFAAAREAALALLPRHLQDEADTHENILLPAPLHMGQVELFEICRLTHRPHTAATAAWWAKIEELDVLVAGLREIIAATGHPIPRMVKSRA